MSSLSPRHLTNQPFGSSQQIVPHNSPANPPQTSPSSAEAAVRQAVQEVFEGLNTPTYFGPTDIFKCDEDGNYLRYDLPKMSLVDYKVPTKGLYRGKSVALLMYDPNVGMHACVSLKKVKEQAEDDYEELLPVLGCKRSILHNTDVEPDQFIRLQRKFFPAAYAAASQERKKKQRELLEAAVAKYKQTGLFKDVFIAEPEYRTRVLGYVLENTVCWDQIFFLYKPLEPIVRPKVSFGRTTVTMVYDGTRERLIERSRELELENQPFYRKLWDRLPSLPIMRREAAPQPPIPRSSIKIEEIPADSPPLPTVGNEVPPVGPKEEQGAPKRSYLGNLVFQIVKTVKTFFSWLGTLFARLFGNTKAGARASKSA